MKVTSIFAAAVLCAPFNVQAANGTDICAITPGMNRNEVHEIIKGGQETSNGLKEVYEFDNGDQAVMHYCGDTLLRVYMIGEGE